LTGLKVLLTRYIIVFFAVTYLRLFNVDSTI